VGQQISNVGIILRDEDARHVRSIRWALGVRKAELVTG
jgi:hypothetical protein